jgi:iron complex outermembrane recepter protein
MRIFNSSVRGLLLRVAACFLLGATGAEAQSTLEEVVVTAQKRSENVQDVPIAISAFTADVLQERAVGDVASISNLAPNVTLDAGTAFSGSSSVLSAYIRGIGSSDFAFNIDPGVGVYLDDVYLARTVGANQDLLDVERIEVLKGPQGTLFGRNTIGGAIRIVTRDPGRKFDGKLDVTTGSYRRLQVKGYVDVPFSDSLRSSLAFGMHQREGYQRRIPYPVTDLYVVNTDSDYTHQGVGNSNRQGGNDNWNARGKLVWDQGGPIRVTLAADYTHVAEEAIPNSLLGTSENTPFIFAVTADRGTDLGFGPTALYNPASGLPPNGFNFAGLYNFCIGATPQQIAARNAQFLCGTRGTLEHPSKRLPGLGSVNVDGDPFNNRLPFNSSFVTGDPDTTYATGNDYSRLQTYGYAATVNYDLSHEVALKSITAYRELHWSTGMDLDGSPMEIAGLSFEMNQHQFSEELQMLGSAANDTLKYVVGGYYFEEGGNLHDWVTFSEGLLQVDGPNVLQTKNYAFFSQLDWRPVDLIGVTVGGRYTHEIKQFEGFQSDLNGFNYKLTGFPAGDVPIPDFLRAAAGFPNPGQPLRYYVAGVQEKKFRNFSPKAGLQLHINNDIMAYGSWSKGYKTGGWTTRLSNPRLDAPGFDEEKANTWELGVKSTLLNRHLQANAAVFTTEYQGIQLNQQQGVSPTLVNAGDARINGAELELTAVPFEAFGVDAAIGYADAYYTSVRPDAVVLPNPYQAGLFKDAELPRTPKWKFSLSPRYELKLADAGSLVLLAAWTHISKTWLDAERTYLVRRPDTDVLDASVTFRNPADEWNLTLGGTNLIDDRYITNGGANLTGGFIQGAYNRPREWYARFEWKF